MNNFYKERNDFLYAKLSLGNYITRGETVLYYEVKTSELGNRAHVLKHLHVSPPNHFKDIP